MKNKRQIYASSGTRKVSYALLYLLKSDYSIKALLPQSNQALDIHDLENYESY